MHKIKEDAERSSDAQHFLVSLFAGTGDPGASTGKNVSALFNHPMGLAVGKDGSVFVLDSHNNCVRRIANGEVNAFKLTMQSSPPSLSGGGIDEALLEYGARLRRPQDIAIDKTGDLYVADTENHRIVIIHPDGSVVHLAGKRMGFRDDPKEGLFRGPAGIAIESSAAKDGIYVSDTMNHRIRRVTMDGAVSTYAGFDMGYQDGELGQASFCFPTGMAIDRQGNIFVCDTGNHRIRKISLQGQVTTFAGSTRGHEDGSALEAKFGGPTRILVTSHGYLFVCDNDPPCVRKISPTGDVTTVAGVTLGNINGTGQRARFSSLNGIAVSDEGDLLVSDTLNHSIKLITAVVNDDDGDDF
jgi:sugar lactone lactonase YvrE